jgi:PBP1b-binding outer membrane lipoprotein LpoB
MKLKTTTLVISIILVLVFITGCSTKTTTTATTQAEPSYASAMTDNILAALSQDNYAKFSQDLDEAMKEAMKEMNFHGLSSQLKDKVGDYVSKELQIVQVKDGITTVVYAAKYTKDDNVTITISFRIVDSQNLVAGLYFNAPSLQ